MKAIRVIITLPITVPLVLIGWPLSKLFPMAAILPIWAMCIAGFAPNVQ